MTEKPAAGAVVSVLIVAAVFLFSARNSFPLPNISLFVIGKHKSTHFYESDSIGSISGGSHLRTQLCGSHVGRYDVCFPCCQTLLVALWGSHLPTKDSRGCRSRLTRNMHRYAKNTTLKYVTCLDKTFFYSFTRLGFLKFSTTIGVVFNGIICIICIISTVRFMHGVFDRVVMFSAER